ncbi:hypothetical protein BH11ARM1_BH11ARM1_15730 [soil metagenome]
MKKSLLVLLALVGTTAFAVIQDKEWTAVKTKDAAITISLPHGWIAADEKDPDYLKSVQLIREKNPKFAEAMKPGENPDQQLLMFNLEDDLADGVMDSMTVVTKNLPGLSDSMLDEIGKQVVATLPSRTKAEYEIIDTPVGKTLTYSGGMDVVVDATTTTKMDLLGYIYLKGETLNVITFATGDQQLKTKKTLFDKIFRTIKS